MKILFLDDDENRINVFLERTMGLDRTITRTAKETIDALKQERFDLISLDHDLGGKQYCPSDEESGYEVVKYMESEDMCHSFVIVHSYNRPAAERMYETLTEFVIPGVVYAPFGATYYWNRFNEMKNSVEGYEVDLGLK